jgi:hypothetical protein
MSDPWTAYMRSGEFERAWEISDAVLRSRAGVPCWHLPRHVQYFWDGTPVNGRRVLVRCYHGLGDTLQFIRYLPMLRLRAAEVLAWVQPRLLPVLDRLEGVDRWLPLHDGDVGVDYDMDVELMELPHVFRTTLETIPCSVPYLHVRPSPLPPSNALKVGIVWKAGDWAEDRSIPFDVLSPLFDLPVAWYILQGHPGLTEGPAGLGTVTGTTDIPELAQTMRSLDLVITIDSMTAHLAGALAVPVWTLLPAVADWRWMEDRDDSPWYPTMRLFRQQRAGDWAPVIARVRRELEEAARRVDERT